jgi:hypothetical protein
VHVALPVSAVRCLHVVERQQLAGAQHDVLLDAVKREAVGAEVGVFVVERGELQSAQEAGRIEAGAALCSRR